MLQSSVIVKNDESPFLETHFLATKSTLSGDTLYGNTLGCLFKLINGAHFLETLSGNTLGRMLKLISETLSGNTSWKHTWLHVQDNQRNTLSGH